MLKHRLSGLVDKTHEEAAAGTLSPGLLSSKGGERIPAPSTGGVFWADTGDHSRPLAVHRTAGTDWRAARHGGETEGWGVVGLAVSPVQGTHLVSLSVSECKKEKQTPS